MSHVASSAIAGAVSGFTTHIVATNLEIQNDGQGENVIDIIADPNDVDSDIIDIEPDMYGGPVDDIIVDPNDVDSVPIDIDPDMYGGPVDDIIVDPDDDILDVECIYGGPDMAPDLYPLETDDDIII